MMNLLILWHVLFYPPVVVWSAQGVLSESYSPRTAAEDYLLCDSC